MSQAEEDQFYFTTKKALFRAIKEYEEGPSPEEVDDKPKAKPDKSKKTKKEKEVKVKASPEGFGDLSSPGGKRKNPKRR